MGKGIPQTPLIYTIIPPLAHPSKEEDLHMSGTLQGVVVRACPIVLLSVAYRAMQWGCWIAVYLLS